MLRGVDLKNTVFLHLVQQPIILIGLLFHIRRGLYKEYEVQFEEEKTSNCKEIPSENEFVFFNCKP